jgi:hypothetical protein
MNDWRLVGYIICMRKWKENTKFKCKTIENTLQNQRLEYFRENDYDPDDLRIWQVLRKIAAEGDCYGDVGASHSEASTNQSVHATAPQIPIGLGATQRQCRKMLTKDRPSSYQRAHPTRTRQKLSNSNKYMIMSPRWGSTPSWTVSCNVTPTLNWC